jgi:hypothetical protein
MSRRTAEERPPRLADRENKQRKIDPPWPMLPRDESQGHDIVRRGSADDYDWSLSVGEHSHGEMRCAKCKVRCVTVLVVVRVESVLDGSRRRAVARTVALVADGTSVGGIKKRY